MHPTFENAALGEGERERGRGRRRGGGGRVRVGSTAPTLHNPRKNAVIQVRTCRKEAVVQELLQLLFSPSNIGVMWKKIDNFSLGSICLRLAS